VTEPNPIWGLHIAPGALAGALVMRTESGHEVLETFSEPAPTEISDLHAAAVAVLGRRGVRGRAALVAAPDHACSVTTGQIPTEDLYLNDEEIFHQLHDFAPFEPGEGHLAYVGVGRSDERRFLVAGIPFDAHSELEELAQSLDGDYHGIGLATPSLLTGARALGLGGERRYLIDVQARLTAILAIDHQSLRRYLLPVGIEQCEASVEVAALLATDILRTTDYHVEQARREDPSEDSERAADLVFAGPSAGRAAQLLGPLLGARVAAAGSGTAPRTPSGDVTGPDGAPLDSVATTTCLGAVGAALTAFGAAEKRLVLRHPPSDVPEYEESEAGRGRLVAACVLIVAALAAATWMVLTSGGQEKESGVVDRRSAPTGAEAMGADPGALTAAAAHDALSDLVEREARLRAYAAVLAAERSWSPPHRAQSLTLGSPPNAPKAPDDPGETWGANVMTLVVDGGVTPAIEQGARDAVASIEGVGSVVVTGTSRQLRIEFVVDRAPLPPPGDGDRLLEPRLVEGDENAVPRRVVAEPSLSFVASISEDEEWAWRTRPGAAVALTSIERDFATERFRAIDALLADLPTTVTVPLLTGASVNGGVATLTIEPPPSTPVQLLRRRLPGGTWEDAVTLEAGVSDVTDHVPGATGRYAWTLGGGVPDAPVIEADVVIEVGVELAGVNPESRSALFKLRRTFRGDVLDHTTSVTVGDAIAGVSAVSPVHFDSGLRLVSIVERKELEDVTIQVPRFRSDGKIERGDRGVPVLVAQPGERSVTVVDVTAEDAEGEPTTWVRKMTDG